MNGASFFVSLTRFGDKLQQLMTKTKSHKKYNVSTSSVVACFFCHFDSVMAMLMLSICPVNIYSLSCRQLFNEAAKVIQPRKILIRLCGDVLRKPYIQDAYKEASV